MSELFAGGLDDATPTIISKKESKDVSSEGIEKGDQAGSSPPDLHQETEPVVDKSFELTDAPASQPIHGDQKLDGLDSEARCGPQTDSGYGSLQHKEAGLSSGYVHQCEDDNFTIYTQESDLNSTTTESYIGEFAKLLSESLGLDRKDIVSTGAAYGSFEELLKSFAMRLGHGASSQEGFRLVAFVHRYRRNIIDAFERLHLESSESPISTPRATDGMDYLEKVTMWTSVSGTEPQDFGAPIDIPIEEDGSVDGLDREEEAMPEILIYRKLIEDSRAYTWLLAQLRQKTVISNAGPDIKQSIRMSILRALPEQSKISRMGPTESINAVYNVHVDLLQALKRQQYREELSYAFEHAVTITGSDETAQAETCIRYLNQTWPLTGEWLLRLLKRAIRSAEGVQHTSNAGDGSLLTACMGSGKLVVTALGSRDSVADVGEQLAWLGSAFQQSPVSEGPVFGIAEVHGASSRRLDLSASSEAPIEFECTIEFRTEHLYDQKQSVTVNGNCWHRLFLRPVIAKGFPIPTRDVARPGLEIPLHMMATLAQAKRVTSFHGKLYAKGFSTLLVPTERSGNIVSWHLLFNEDRQRLPYTDLRIRDLQDPSVEQLDFGDLENVRHILGWASTAETIAGTLDANLNIRRSGLTGREAGCVLEKVSVSAGKHFGVGASIAIGVDDVPRHLNRGGSYIDQIRDAYNNYVILYDVDDKRSWLVNGATALLYIVRASLHESASDKFRSHFLFKTADLKDSSTPHSSDSAIEVLICGSNMELKITRDKAEIWTETTKDEDGSPPKVIEKRKEKFVYFQDLVDEKWHIFEQLLDQQSKIAAPGVRLTWPGRQYLEGFDFTDVATRISDLEPKATKLQARGKGWVDFTRSIRAITLFGRGFGEIIRPSKDCDNLCSLWSSVPKGIDYLAVSVSDLEEIAKRRGDPIVTPVRLVGDICWHKPDKLFESCRCKGKTLKRAFMGLSKSCDRVQVLLSSKSRIPRLVSPGSFDGMYKGAIIFGHSKLYPLRWADHEDPEQGEPTPPPEQPTSSSTDSGIGSSIPSSSSNETILSKRRKCSGP